MTTRSNNNRHMEYIMLTTNHIYPHILLLQMSSLLSVMYTSLQPSIQSDVSWKCYQHYFCEGNPLMTSGFPSRRASNSSLDDFFTWSASTYFRINNLIASDFWQHDVHVVLCNVLISTAESSLPNYQLPSCWLYRAPHENRLYSSIDWLWLISV